MMERVAVTDFRVVYGKQLFELTPSTSLSEHLKNPSDGSKDRFDTVGVIRFVHHEVPITERGLGDRGSVVIGCSKGNLRSLERRKNRDFLDASPDYFADFIARRRGFTGRVLSPNAACATGVHALALGAGLVQYGDADVVIAGAVELSQHPMVLAAYKNMGALSKSGTMRPFSTNRDGFIPNQGTGFFILESERRAKSRGANIHGYITGWSLKCDATHMTSMCPSGDTIARAIEDTLKRAGNPQIDYINAHGTATINDAIEARGIQSVFGKSVPISSTKPLTGHLMGAAGAVEAAICLLALREGFAPPTLNLESPDAAIELDTIPNNGRHLPLNAVLSLNYGFGGHIGALIFEKN